LRRGLTIWLPVAAAATVLAGLIYAAVQHDLRSGANDPQVQMAEDAARALDHGALPSSVVAPSAVDMATSLAAFLIVVDRSGQPVASSAELHGRSPVPPAGVLDAARRTGENTLTWQPEAGVRIASVTVPYRDGYVVAGRSLRLVEQRESDVELIVGLGWLATLVVSAVVTAVALTVLARRS